MKTIHTSIKTSPRRRRSGRRCSGSLDRTLPSSILDKSLHELEQSDLGEPTYDSYLGTTIHRLRRLPLRQFGVEDLRILIGRNIGLQYLIPLAFEYLRKNPLAEGDFYPGDLLNMVLTADPNFWQDHRQWRKEVDEIAERADAV